MNNEQITVRVREVYGRRLVYPVCERARIFAQIAGAATLTPDVVKLIKALGFGLVVAPDEVTV
jgi:hypothetical protein